MGQRDRNAPQQHGQRDDGERGKSRNRGRRRGTRSGWRVSRPGYIAPASAGCSGGTMSRDAGVMRITSPAAIRHSNPAPMKAP